MFLLLWLFKKFKLVWSLFSFVLYSVSVRDKKKMKIKVVWITLNQGKKDLYHNILMLQLGYIYGNFIPLQTFDAESK